MNMIPFDNRKPLDPSGIRIGTAALTTRGMKEADMQEVGQWILRVLKSADDEAADRQGPRRSPRVRPPIPRSRHCLTDEI